MCCIFLLIIMRKKKDYLEYNFNIKRLKEDFYLFKQVDMNSFSYTAEKKVILAKVIVKFKILEKKKKMYWNLLNY